MKFLIDENGQKTIQTTHDRWGVKFERTWRVFETKIPADYVMWNIGANFEYLEEGWLPLCKIKKGTKYDVDMSTLATVYVGRDSTPFLDHVCGIYGVGSIKEAKRFLKRAKKANRIRIVKKALEMWQQIQKEEE